MMESMGHPCRHILIVENELTPGEFVRNLVRLGGDLVRMAKPVCFDPDPAGGLQGRRKWFLWDEAVTWYTMDQDVVAALRATGGAVSVTVNMIGVEGEPYTADYAYNLWHTPEGDRVTGVTVDRYDYKMARCAGIAERRHL